MTGPSIGHWLGRAAGATLLALLLSGAARAEGPADTQEALASHFRTAPEAVPPQMQLVQIFVNGVDSGLHQIIVASGTVSLPAPTVVALRIAGVPGDTSLRPGRAWTAPFLEVSAPAAVHAGVDGEAVDLSPPLRFAIRPAALRVRISSRHPGASPSARLHSPGLPGPASR